MRDYTNNESLNEFIAVEIAQTAARSVDTIAQEFALATDQILNDEKVKEHPGAAALALYNATLKSGKRTYENFATAIDRIVTRTKHEEKEKEKEKTNQANIDYAINNLDLILNMYWDGSDNNHIAECLGIDETDVDTAIKTKVPIDLIFEKYNGGMLPSRIGRLAAVMLSTNRVRRVLNMPAYKAEK